MAVPNFKFCRLSDFEVRWTVNNWAENPRYLLAAFNRPALAGGEMAVAELRNCQVGSFVQLDVCGEIATVRWPILIAH